MEETMKVLRKCRVKSRRRVTIPEYFCVFANLIENPLTVDISRIGRNNFIYSYFKEYDLGECLDSGTKGFAYRITLPKGSAKIGEELWMVANKENHTVSFVPKDYIDDEEIEEVKCDEIHETYLDYYNEHREHFDEKTQKELDADIKKHKRNKRNNKKKYQVPDILKNPRII